MNKQNIPFWISIALSALFGIFVTGFGIYLLIKGQDCRSYNDYACAFSAMFSFVIIPYGLAVLAFVGLAALPFKVASLIGSILSALAGFANVGLCCVTTTWTLSSDGASLLSSDMGTFLLFPLVMFLGGLALISVGIIGYLKAK